MSRWFRHYAGMMSDPKFGAVARRCRRCRAEVLFVWGCILESAAEYNSSVYAFDADAIAELMGVETQIAQAIHDEFVSTGLLQEGRISKWENRQFTSDSSTERSRKHREASRNAAATLQQQHATPPETETETETDTEADTKQSRKKGRGASAPPAPHSEADGLGSDDAAAVANYWNNIAEEHGLSAVRRMTDTRRKKINARLSEAGGLRKVAEVIDAIPAQPFLLGRNDRQWKVDFDWLLEPSNFVKVEERKYANGHA